MDSRWNIQALIIAVLFLVLGCFSQGIAGNKKILLNTPKGAVQKTTPSVAKNVKPLSLPDLTVTKITILPGNPKTSGKITTIADIKNTGKGIAAPSLFKIQIGGKIYPLIRVPRLAPNQKWQYKTKVNIKRPGSYRVTGHINPNKKIPEANYRNNNLFKNFSIKKAASRQPLPPGSLSPPSFKPITKFKPLTLAVQFSIAINDFVISRIPGTDNGVRWLAGITNTGINTPANGRLKSKVFIIAADGSESESGTPQPLQGLLSGKIISKSGYMGDKNPGMYQLRLEIWDSQVNIRLTNETIQFPSNAELDVEPVRRFLQIQSSEYLNNGNWQVTIKNTGNSDINPNEINIRAKYYIGSPSYPQSIPFYNNDIINPGQSKTISGYGKSNETGCGRFTNIDIIVYDSIKDKTYLDNILTPDVLGATIDEVVLERSRLSYRMINSTPHPINVTVVLESIEIWDGPKPPSNNNSWWEDFVDFLDGAEFDTSGWSSPQYKCTAQNIVLGSHTLKSGYNFMYSWPNEQVFNNWIKAKCPGVNFSSYTYFFKNLHIKLLHELIPVNPGNSNGQDTCLTPRKLDFEKITEGGSHDMPAFSW